MTAASLAGIGLLLSGCASVPDALTLNGTLSYRQRIALAPDAVAVLELRNALTASGPPIAEQRVALAGRQVPVAFALKVDRSRLVEGRPYSLRGTFVEAGRVSWASGMVIVEKAIIEKMMIGKGAGPIDLGMLTMAPVPAAPVNVAMRCGDQRIGVAYVAGTMQLTLDAERLELQQVVAASGARYESPADPGTSFWSKGERGTLTVKGRALPDCEPA